MEWDSPTAPDMLSKLILLGSSPPPFPLPYLHPSMSAFFCTFLAPFNPPPLFRSPIFISTSFLLPSAFSVHCPEGLGRQRVHGLVLFHRLPVWLLARHSASWAPAVLPIYGISPHELHGVELGETEPEVLWKLKFREEYIKGWKDLSFGYFFLSGLNQVLLGLHKLHNNVLEFFLDP